jgi:hypothetical protein
VDHFVNRERESQRAARDTQDLLFLYRHNRQAFTGAYSFSNFTIPNFVPITCTYAYTVKACNSETVNCPFSRTHASSYYNYPHTTSFTISYI